MNITLYQTGDDEHTINRHMTTLGTYSCNIKNPQDIENPEIELNAITVSANYAYIPDFGRYYWLTPMVKNNAITLYKGKSDVLNSFKGGILTSPCVISRNPWHFDLYLPDNKMPIESRKAAGVLPFPNNYFSGNNNCFILTTLGG